MKIKATRPQQFGKQINLPILGIVNIPSDGILDLEDEKLAKALAESDEWELHGNYDEEEEELDEEYQEEEEDEEEEESDEEEDEEAVDLESMSLKDMQEIAKSSGIKGYEKYKTEKSLRTYLKKYL